MMGMQKQKVTDMMKTENCYLCETQMKKGEAIKKAKKPGGDIFLWCKKCYKKVFVRKKKLLRK